MIDLDSYTFNGWGLSKNAMVEIQRLIEDYGLTRAIEFGSGQSTRLLSEVGIEYLSLDDSHDFKSPLDNVIVTDLKQASDSQFDDIINGRVKYTNICSSMRSMQHRSTRQRNCFYDLEPNTISGDFDLIILDGPNGNGRSISFNVLQDHIGSHAYILIDDYDHYDFIPHLKLMFKEVSLLYICEKDRFVIYKILGDKKLI